MIIYLVRNLQNGKVYVGQTIQSLKKRWWRHINDSQKTNLRTGCVALRNAMKKYGVESFKVEQIAQASTREELNELERHWISVFDSTKRENGYNLMLGGEGPQHTEETKIKIGNSGRGQKRSKEFCEKLRKRMVGNSICKGRIGHLSGMFGKTHSEETKEKMRCKRPGITGKNHYLYGKRMADEHCQAISRGQMGNQRRKGKKHSPETRKQISETTSLTLFLKTVAWG